MHIACLTLICTCESDVCLDTCSVIKGLAQFQWTSQWLSWTILILDALRCLTLSQDINPLMVFECFQWSMSIMSIVHKNQHCCRISSNTQLFYVVTKINVSFENITNSPYSNTCTTQVIVTLTQQKQTRDSVYAWLDSNWTSHGFIVLDLVKDTHELHSGL